jgi:uncharacterized membrane protein YfcA
MQFLVIGLCAGILAGMFGIGGGVIVVPALMVVAKMAPHKATGTSLAALLLPVGLLGVWRYYRAQDVAIGPAAWIAFGLFVGALLGADLALRLPGRELQRAFAVFLVFVAGYLWWKA